VQASASRGLPFSLHSLDSNRKKIDGANDRQQDNIGERRRLSRVRHDDRGNAYVEWIDAPAEMIERPKLEIQRDAADLQLETESSAHNPYANGSGGARKTGNTTRTDLRKLSEWIKMMRELEERKRHGGGDDPEE
jgi:hypothetical protein